MYNLYFDATEKNNKIVSLIDNENATVVDSIFGSIDLVASVRELLKRNGVELTKIVDIKVNTGPGSYTGIKSSISVANMLKWQLPNTVKDAYLQPNYGSEPNVNIPEIR